MANRNIKTRILSTVLALSMIIPNTSYLQVSAEDDVDAEGVETQADDEGALEGSSNDSTTESSDIEASFDTTESDVVDNGFDNDDSITIVSVETDDDVFDGITYGLSEAPEKSDVIEDLPSEVEAASEDDLGYTLSIEWNSEDYDNTTDGEYIFTASVTDEGFVIGDDVIPDITVTVEDDTIVVKSVKVHGDEFKTRFYTILDAPDEETVTEDFPKQIDVTTEDDEDATLDVQEWKCKNYDNEKLGKYTFYAVLDDNVSISGDILPWITVAVKKVAVSEITTTYDSKKYTTNKAPDAESLVKGFGDTLEAVDDKGNDIEVPVKEWDYEYDPDEAGIYTFTPVVDTDVYDISEIDKLPSAKIRVIEGTKTKLTAECEDVTVVVTAEPGVLPEGTTLEVESVTGEERETKEQAAIEAAESENFTVKYVFDITLKDKDGNEIEPDGEVSVTFRNAFETTEDAEAVKIHHFKDDSDEAEEMETETDGTSVETTTDSFSTYTVGVEGKVTGISSFATQVMSGAEKQSNGDWVWTPANEASGHRFAFRVNYNTSGTGSMNPAVVTTTTNASTGKVTATAVTGGIQIRVPKSIIKDRDGVLDDTYEMSLNSFDDIVSDADGELADEEWAYCEIGDEIIVYNRKTVDAAQSGYFEIGYATNSETFEYKDYGADGSKSNPFTAKITASGQSKEAAPLYVYINTTATLSYTDKAYPTQKGAWNSSWGTYTPKSGEQSDGSDYFWQFWTITSNIGTATQKYNFYLLDQIESCTGKTADGAESNVKCEVYAYKTSGGTLTLASDVKDTNGVKVENLKADDKRFDYIITRVKKSDLQDSTGSYKITSFTIKNNVTATVDPIDQVDADTVKTSSRQFSWTLPTFVSPTGHFYMRKFGDENWQGKWNYRDHDEREYSSYDLDQLQDGTVSEIADLKYAVWAYGWAYPWTLADGAVSADYDKYGQKKVTYTVSDSDFYPLDSDGTQNGKTVLAGTEIPTTSDLGATKLKAADYDIRSIDYDYYFEDAKRDANGNTYLDDDTQNFVIEYVTPTEDDVLTVYTTSGDSVNYVKAGTFNLGTKTWNGVSGSKVKSMTDSTITFDAGVDGFRITNSNYYYHTNFCFYPKVTIFRTANVQSWIGKSGEKMAVVLKNVANCDVTDSKGTSVYNENKMSGDRLRATERESSINKKITATSNDTRKKNYKITWKVGAYEAYKTLKNDKETAVFLPQETGTFYDLLPEGSSLLDGSVQVEVPTSNDVDPTYWVKYGSGSAQYLNNNEFEIETTDNYSGSGRTLLTVRIKTQGYAYAVYYTTVHPWDSIKDYGRDTKNPVAYETGNSKITGGKKDNPSDALMSDGASKMSDTNQAYMKYLHYKQSDGDNIPNAFIYDEETHNITALTAATSGLSKRVMSSRDENWKYTTTVFPSETYRYRLRYANTYTASAKGMILYDSLENFYLSDDHDTIGQSEWKGTYSSIDLSQLQSLVSYQQDGKTAYKKDGKDATLAPVVYYHLDTNLDLDKAAGYDPTDLSDTAYWTTTKPSDLSRVKGIAIDCRYDTAGNEFILQPGASLTSVVYMTAPSSDTSNIKEARYPETYNNVYMKVLLADIDGNYKSEADYIHHNYTTVKYSIASKFGVHKVNENNKQESIYGVTFRLTGTSSYGTVVNEQATTDKEGKLSFKNIEKGTYSLVEDAASNDWIEDHTEHIVTIDGTGKVTIDGTDYTPASDGAIKYITITNKPRVHITFSFTKMDFAQNAKLEGVTFVLYGASDYGTDVYKTAVSDSSGKVMFDDVEKGTYTLKETETKDGYILSTATYTVKILENLTYTITAN